MMMTSLWSGADCKTASVSPGIQKVLVLLCYKSINIWLVVTICSTAFATAVSYINALYSEESLSNRQKTVVWDASRAICRCISSVFEPSSLPYMPF